jgi:hypothetical protein
VKIFSIAEAERTIPLVSRIASDLRDEYRAWQAAMARYELAVAGTRAEEGEPETAVHLREDISLRAERIKALLDELDELGCELKDFEQGLVDFYALLEDRLVFLCWRLGEERITWWHEVDAGFAGRQPIDQTLFPGIVP